MSGLARLLAHDGIPVSGSDRQGGAAVDALRALGVTVAVGHAAENVPPDAVVVLSDAISKENPERAVAEERGQRVIRRSELLGEMMAGKEGVAIAGTHGKTTTTALVAHILLQTGQDPTVVVGGESLGPEGNAHAGSGRLFVAEACEAYDSFLHLSPAIALVNNVDKDHLDHHGTMERIREVFRDFTDRITPGGTLVVNADDPETVPLAERHAARGGRVESFGLRSGRWQARDIAANGPAMTFEVTEDGAPVGRTRLHLPGIHNVSNAMAAFAVARVAGLPSDAILAALGRFGGVGRRFERRGERNGVSVYDDYAHHPKAVRATLAAARAAFGNGGGRIIAVFQPHQFSRTQEMMDDYIASFDDADAAVITEIYLAREEPIPGVTAATMVQGIAARRPDIETWFTPAVADVPGVLRGLARPGDVVILMGAGNINAATVAFLSDAPEAAK